MEMSGSEKMAMVVSISVVVLIINMLLEGVVPSPILSTVVAITPSLLALFLFNV